MESSQMTLITKFDFISNINFIYIYIMLPKGSQIKQLAKINEQE